MEEYKAKVLRRLLNRKCIGEKHTAIEHCYGGIPKHAVIAAKYATKELINEGLIMLKVTDYGMHVSLNPNRMQDIKKLLAE